MELTHRLFRQLLVVFLLLLTTASILSIVAWHSSGIRLYTMPDSHLSPVLQRGDLLVVNPNIVPKTGDIVNRTNPVDSRTVITTQLTSLQAQDDLVGVTTKALPLAGYLLDLLRRPAGLAIFIYIPAFMIMRSELKRLNRQVGPQPYTINGIVSVRSHSTL